jgi:hypothetical protein
MGTRRINPNLIKVHRTYDVFELAACCGVHKNTVLHWRDAGLAPIDAIKPILFHGAIVREFLRARNAARKRPCGPGKLYCFRCRTPRAPAFGLLEYVPITAKSGNVRAFCETCEAIMHRRVPLSAMAVTMPNLDVQFSERPLRLVGDVSPSVNCDSERQAAA